ncbi:Beta-amylase 1, chloroplastic [Galdieria sulphuraria]|nr:Beta-amylase 1, chloroplastic [Galdieria sulphuraria]
MRQTGPGAKNTTLKTIETLSSHLLTLAKSFIFVASVSSELALVLLFRLVVPANDRVSEIRYQTASKDAIPMNVLNYSSFGVPVYVMMPLSSVTVSGDLVENYDGYDLQWILKQWKKNGVYGLMVDVWFGVVEKTPKQYRWEPYIQLCKHLRQAGLKLQTVMSFHRCGGNVGDRCYIPLPQWVLDAAANNSDIFFKDQEGNVDPEYISWGVDMEPVIAGRSAIQIYSDFLASFRDNLREFLGDVIVYQLNRWTFCGVGEFQCYDRYLLSRLEQAAKEVEHPDWAHPPYPYDVGNYNSRPEQTLFFKEDGGIWNTQYGDFFLRWYSKEMIEHADRILQVANDVFFNDKIPDSNWKGKSHASELTAGYYNTRFRDGYTPIFQILKKYDTTAVFTCTEMRDKNQPQDCNCSPEDLVGLIVRASIATNVSFAGENAVSFYDADSYRQISLVARSYSVVRGIPMEAMTYLRWPEPITIFMGDNFITPLGQKFFEFVRVMGTDDAISHVIPVF